MQSEAQVHSQATVLYSLVLIWHWDPVIGNFWKGQKIKVKTWRLTKCKSCHLLLHRSTWETVPEPVL